MVFQVLLAGIGRQYLVGAVRGFGAIAATSGGTLGNFNAAELLSGRNNPTVEITNLVALERQLKEFGPKAFNDFKAKARRVGTPARNAVREGFSRIGSQGPLGYPRRPGRTYDGFHTENGRLAWSKSYSEVTRNTGIDVNYKSRNLTKELYNLKTGKDGAISVLRIRVKKPALIMADMAGRGGKAMYSQGRYKTRKYKINLYGKGVVERDHRINAQNSIRFVDKLTEKSQKRGSRYAYPALEKHIPEYTRDVDNLLTATIAEMNRSLKG